MILMLMGNDLLSFMTRQEIDDMLGTEILL